MSVKDRPWEYQTLADTMLEIHAEDVCNDTYGRVRMFHALTLKRSDGIPIPSERTVDITEIKVKDGKRYVSAIFDCFDSAVLGLAMETTMKATLCQHTVENAFIAYPEIRGAMLHSDRGTQYISFFYLKNFFTFSSDHTISIFLTLLRRFSSIAA